MSLEKESLDNPDWLKAVRANREYAAEQFDKLVVYIAGGALVLTIGFVKDIVKITSDTNTSLLKISWICFALTLLVILVSQMTSAKAMDSQLDHIEDKAQKWNTALSY